MKYIQYRETRKHGTFDFPLAFYHVTPSHPRYEMAYHWHMEYEIIRIIKGEFLMMMNEEEFTAKEGDIIFIKEGVLHGGYPNHCVYECVVFDLNALVSANHAGQKFLRKLTGNAIEIYPHFSDNNELHRLIRLLFETLRSKAEGHELIVTGALYQFFGYVLEHRCYTPTPETSIQNARRIEQLKSVLALIETSYSEPLTLETLAKEAGMTPKYFCRFFRDMTHRTPIDYLNYYRIEQACFRLATSCDSITEVALSCGFNDISYFIKTFKKYKGLTPKKYLSAPL